MKKIYLLYLYFSFFIPSISRAQSSGSVSDDAHQLNAWIMYFGNHRIADKWKLHTEYQWRRHDFLDKWQQSLLRFGVEYQINKNMNATLGYGWIYSYPYGDQPILSEIGEHRIWQQFQQIMRLGRLEFQHRYRLEQRWIDKVVPLGDGTSLKVGTSYNNRVRYRLLINLPLSRPQIIPGCIFLSLYDEIFVGLSKNQAHNLLDQNRLYAALGYQFSPSGSIQIGYLNQLLVKSNGVQREINHTLQLSVTQHFDFKKN